jgi:hypothetical protein
MTTNASHFKHMLKCGKGNCCLKVSEFAFGAREIVVLAAAK